MTMTCWPNEPEDDAFDAAVRRAVRRAVVIAAAVAGAAGVAVWAAWAQPADAWQPMPGRPSLSPGPDVPARCLTDDGWAYAAACCCTHGWCARIPCDAVREEAGGFTVRLAPGMHPRVLAPFAVLVPRNEVQGSPDGLCHLCASKQRPEVPGQARCLLMPPGVM